MASKYYLVRVFMFYDRGWIEVDKFVTKNPKKYQNQQKYKVEPIKFKTT